MTATNPRLSESLAGRARLVDFWPLAVGEVENTAQRFVHPLFGGTLASSEPRQLRRGQVGALIVRGGFPEVVTEPQERFRQAFFADRRRR
jgi:uncharacterized protein